MKTLLLFDIGALEKIKFFGSQLIDVNDLGELVFRFAINLLFVFIIIRLIFYPIYKQKQYLFTYFLFNITIFLVCILLSNVKLKIGFAFGLFAVFSILRYRTETIPIREMTYLFVIITMGVINALSSKKVSYAELLFTNVVIVFTIYGLERIWFQKKELIKDINYEKIELINPEKYDQLIKDLRERTGLDIHRVDIVSINFLRDTARLKIYYYEKIVTQN
ncbi:MAG: DUF4956 domain-containing protein [Cytophagales bacterium]|nr:DUF4956 domain-containing protein [Cytophagales bacterium]